MNIMGWSRIAKYYQIVVRVILLTQNTDGRFILPERDESVSGTKEFGRLYIDISSHEARPKRDVTDVFPDVLACQITIGGEPIKLDLRRNKQLDVAGKVYVIKRGAIVTETITPLMEVKYFQDINKDAAFGVICEKNLKGTCEFKLEGIFEQRNKSYAIYPSEQAHAVEQGNAENVQSYVIETLNQTTDFADGYILADGYNFPNTGQYRIRREVTKQDLNVELMMVTDSSVYRYWLDRTSGSTVSERRSLALASINQYYAFVLNGIDARYKHITEKDFSLNVLFSGLLIFEETSESHWTDGITTTNPNDENRPIVDATQALSRFKIWRQQTSDLPPSDHVTLFTAYDLQNKGSTATSGLAYTGGICGSFSISICESRFDFRGIVSAAHELGHSLGATHDGNGNACLSGDNYIMAPVSGKWALETAQNPWHFSSCSVDYFRSKIQQLDGSGSNCLRTESSSLDPTALDPFLQKIPGQIYSADTQCAYNAGKGSILCRALYNETTYSNICWRLYCTAGTDSCTAHIPAKGTSCGNNKWCENGACVINSNAPAVSESCPHGDVPGIIRKNTLTCAQLAQSQADLCYQSYYSQRCCTSCPSVRTNKTGCEYGDKADCSGFKNGFSCYHGNNEEICCQTCYSYHTNIVGCEYGDKADCSSMSPSACYITTNQELCCKSCHNFKTYIPGCAYGDKAKGCDRQACSSSESYRSQCCGTCYEPTTTVATSTVHPAITSATTTATTVPSTSKSISPTTTTAPKTTKTTALPTTSTTTATTTPSLATTIIPPTTTTTPPPTTTTPPNTTTIPRITTTATIPTTTVSSRTTPVLTTLPKTTPTPHISTEKTSVHLNATGVSKSTSNISISTSNTSIPTSNTSIPTSNSSMPTSNSSMPTSNSSMPTSNTGLPTSNSSIPTSNTSITTSNTSIPTSNTSIPTSNASKHTFHISASASNTSVPVTKTSVSTIATALPSTKKPTVATTSPHTTTTIAPKTLPWPTLPATKTTPSVHTRRRTVPTTARKSTVAVATTTATVPSTTTTTTVLPTIAMLREEWIVMIAGASTAVLILILARAAIHCLLKPPKLNRRVSPQQYGHVRNKHLEVKAHYPSNAWKSSVARW